jgi:S-adenosylmethionine/arginine decarboxylase-like enzyme
MRLKGKHLIVDGRADAGRLQDREVVGKLLRGVVELAEMALVDLKVYLVEGADPPNGGGEFVDDGGLTGYAVLTTSHASIHTWPNRGEFRFDLYSCRPFDHRAVEEFVLRQLSGRSDRTIDWER